MKVTDYIVEFLISKKVTDIFGYPGGVICHLMDSVAKYPNIINAHLNYHEQAAAFAACGYAQEKCSMGVAYSTSGPGATNLITGIANAYFDSIPVMFFTGQVDTYSLKEARNVRQFGFQETDICSMVSSVTKYAVRVDKPEMIAYELEKAYAMANGGNPGPVVIDLPADVQRADVDINVLKHFYNDEIVYSADNAVKIYELLKDAKRPCFLIGNGVKQSGMREAINQLIDRLGIPAVFSMPAFDTVAFDNKYNFGFIGANGHRYANFIIGKSDLIISIGSRLDLKQVGNNRSQFAPNAKIIRIDIDSGNFDLAINDDDVEIVDDIKTLIPKLIGITDNWKKNLCDWNKVCNSIKNKLAHFDDDSYSALLYEFCKKLMDDCTVTCDVGQSEVWIAQQLEVKEQQSVHLSAGHGTMGYSLPAAIGAYYANPRTIISFNGDGGIQMNLQEMQFLARERIPVKVVVINNHSLGMIRGFQEANFDKKYIHTIENGEYLAPDFSKLAHAFDIKYQRIETLEDVRTISFDNNDPEVIEINIECDTYLNPNFGRNGNIQDARPYINRELYDEIMGL